MAPLQEPMEISASEASPTRRAGPRLSRAESISTRRAGFPAPDPVPLATSASGKAMPDSKYFNGQWRGRPRHVPRNSLLRQEQNWAERLEARVQTGQAPGHADGSAGASACPRSASTPLHSMPCPTTIC